MVQFPGKWAANVMTRRFDLNPFLEGLEALGTDAYWAAIEPVRVLPRIK